MLSLVKNRLSITLQSKTVTSKGINLIFSPDRIWRMSEYECLQSGLDNIAIWFLILQIRPRLVRQQRDYLIRQLEKNGVLK